MNKNVLSFVLNVATLSAFLAYSGVVFHNGGAAVENSRPPYVLDQLWLGCIIANGTTIVVLLVDDIPQSEVPADCSLKILYMIRRMLGLVLSSTGSQRMPPFKEVLCGQNCGLLLSFELRYSEFFVT